MPRGSALESSITGALIRNVKKLQAAGFKIHIMKVHGGQWTSGQPDLMGCYNGRMFVIEMKTDIGRVTGRQEEALKKWEQSGALAIVGRDAILPLLKIDAAFSGIISQSKKEKAVTSKAQDTAKIPASFD
jgi:hypothetical protein